MTVVGGTVQTLDNSEASCYSQGILTYDVVCDTWHRQELPQHLLGDLER